jgi:hypothetical protein
MIPEINNHEIDKKHHISRNHVFKKKGSIWKNQTWLSARAKDRAGCSKDQLMLVQCFIH